MCIIYYVYVLRVLQASQSALYKMVCGCSTTIFNDKCKDIKVAGFPWKLKNHFKTTVTLSKHTIKEKNTPAAVSFGLRSEN